jgi:uncharacterized membrane protein YadS
MGKTLTRTLLFLATSLWFETGHALDSYRFLHVTIDTPWFIFLFLLVAIFSPFILMAALAWRYAERKVDHASPENSESETHD